MKFIAAIPAIAFVLDIIFYRYQRAIYDHFYKWWFHLSELQMSTVVQRAVNIFFAFDTKICGYRLASLRSAIVGVFITSATTLLAFFLLPHESAPVGVLLGAVLSLAVFNLPVGLISFFITRLLLRVLRFADSIPLATAIALVAVMAVELIVLVFWFCTGAVAATFLKTEYIHGVSVNGAVSTFVFLILFALGYTHGLLHIVLIPLYLFTSFVALLLIIHLLGKICIFAENFLAWQVETPQFAAFTVIAVAVAAILELTFLASEAVPVRWLLTKLSEGHEAAAKQTVRNGLTTTWNAFLTEHQKDPALTSYIRQVADGLDDHARKIATGTEDYQKATKLFIPRVFNYLEKRSGIKPTPGIGPSTPPPSVP